MTNFPECELSAARRSSLSWKLKLKIPNASKMQITWPAMSLSRLHLAVGLLAGLLSKPALACSFDISFNSEFEPGKARLSASEVRRMAGWMIDEPRKYENQEEFHIAIYQAPSAGISPALARRRGAHLHGLLTTFGVSTSKISSEIASYRPGKSELSPNLAHVNFMPGCPHPCCPGMVPIVNKAPVN
ncbi:hypothetical protein [Cupriavidus sp. USMAHM13]|uniref:hypothetical protein n=1 Tax=Cupriavidus sp. USMAHM13 TaxID=1389192 RepID=UPI0012EA6C5E|nr:hypothetical protein [Cupriavidus sp. USMAHM13]